ncbi:collagen binding domain-containing protein [Paenibacillus sp. MMS20-IR301]|uniref:collagen binding domain-containing protein n=1 Tax=Paenibacillus sp. MMS20-IR301 TaxID=2895946 RepID=UPI0028E3DE26|nr:collagen binding domain-containing protein [Paenibacillus sp. MMS20-IR301]WNS45187.1 collagen binding domain-containing protein [Paenibacillus sp. MMS20-IR301]
MKVKKINLWLILILMVTQWTTSFGSFTQSAYAEPSNITENLIQSVTLAVYTDDHYSETVTGNVYQLDSHTELNYNWSLYDGHGYKAGSTFGFDLPGQFELYNDLDGELLFGSEAVGTYHVNKDSNHVVFTFNEFIEQYDQVSGTFTVRSLLSSKKISGSTKQLVEFPIHGGTQVIELQFKPNVSSTVEKKGTPAPQFYNPKQINWTVDVNKALESVGNAAVTDVIPAGLSLDTSTIVVRELGVNLDGTVTPGAIVPGSSYNTSGSAPAKLELKFNQSPIIKAYRIEFTTDITASGEDAVSYENTAVFTGDGGLSKESKATVTAGRGKPLNKVTAGYDSATQTISWAIEFNYNEKLIPANDALLKDTVDLKQELIANSLMVYPVTIAADGTGVKDEQPLPDNKYTVTTSVVDGKNQFALKFKDDIHSAYRIEYKTKASERVFKNGNVTNEVIFGEHKESSSQNITQQILSKGNSNIHYLNKTVDWTITINKDSKTMNNLKVTDTFLNAGLKLVPGTLVIKPAGGGAAVVTEVVYTEHNPVTATDGFTIIFKAPIHEPYTITYTTQFNYDWLSEGEDRFVNQAVLEWLETGETDVRTITETSTFNPRAEVKNNGLKNGSYDALAKKITWNIGANYNMKSLAKAKLTDTISEGQIVDLDSVKVFKWVYGKNGNPDEDVNVNEEDYKVTLSGGKLEISFNKTINYAFYVTFKTSFAGQVIDLKEVNNTAVLYDGTARESADLNASVNIPNGGEYINKTGAQNGNKIDWTVYINRNQSVVKDAVLTDLPSANQILLTNTYHLYKTNVAANGTITPASEELVNGKDYTLKFLKDSDGKESFQLKFVSEISEAYILKYQSLIAAQNNEQVSNEVNLEGKNVKEVTKDSNSEITVKLSSGSGTGSGVRGTLSIEKIDASNHSKTLQGAEFDLFRIAGNEQIWINSGVTNVEGKLEFTKLLGGDYTVIEKTSPAGYVLDTTPHPVKINSTTGIELQITNKTTVVPTVAPTVSPSPTASPTLAPTVAPTVAPTIAPTATPTVAPTEAPTATPTVAPTATPTVAPTEAPTATPTIAPTATPTPAPTMAPTETPYVPSLPSSTPTPGVPGVVVTPGPTVTPAVTPTASPEPTVAPGVTPASSSPSSPQPTAVTTIEDVPIEGEIPLGGIPSIGDKPEHGTVVITPDGKWKYTPDPGYTGKDKFTIIINNNGEEQELEIEVVVDEVPKGTVDEPVQQEPANQSGLPGKLPQTGEEAPILIYAAGIGLILLGFILSRKFRESKK